MQRVARETSEEMERLMQRLSSVSRASPEQPGAGGGDQQDWSVFRSHSLQPSKHPDAPCTAGLYRSVHVYIPFHLFWSSPLALCKHPNTEMHHAGLYRFVHVRIPFHLFWWDRSHAQYKSRSKRNNSWIVIVTFKGAIWDFYNLTAPQTVSHTYAQVVRTQSCAKYLQHIERLSWATYCGTCH